MRPRLLVTLALAAWVTAVVCGCGERQPAGSHPSESADVTGPGGAAAAEIADTKSPADDLPDDIPIPDGLHSVSVSSEEPGSLVALFTGEVDPDVVVRDFSEGLRTRGWAIDDSHSRGDERGVFAHKEQRIASVIVTRLSGKLHVELGVWAPH
ncbi:MAG TPA: hypothetical protein VMR86_13400 [Myxococcota bacterium]|nr:hypothetical protein [Myxococcota bacterium]